MRFYATGQGSPKNRTRWKRVLVLIMSLQSYLFFPAEGRSLFSLRTTEAAAASIPRTAPLKLRQKKHAPQRPSNNNHGFTKKALRGTASWYGPHFDGKKTASGEIFDQKKLTAAHKTLPLGSKAIVTNLKNGNSVEVEINDRGPYVRERVIDVSYAAAKDLGLLESGLAPVRIELLQETG